MSSTLSAQESMGSIDKFISEVGAAEKQAGDKSAEAHTEPGSQGGATEHPVKDVDDRTEVAQEGARSSENEADVKEDQGNPGVDSTPEAKAAADGKSEGGAVQTPGSAADDHMQIGTNTQPTGEDPSVETGSAKSGKEDPGSDHPARTDNDELDGHKYSADQLSEQPLEALAKLASDMGNNLCSMFAANTGEEQPQQPKQAADEDPFAAHQAGWELADLISGDFDKAAADELVQSTLEQTIKVASDDADRTIHFLNNFYEAQHQAAMQKAAEGEEGAPPMEDPAAQMGAPPAGGMPPMGGGGEEEMLGALGGAEAPAEAPAGGEEMMGEGGAEADELAQLLQGLGITEEELMAAMAEEEGGGGLGAPGGGEMPPEGAEGMEVEAADAGKINKEARDYVKELIARSRTPRR